MAEIKDFKVGQTVYVRITGNEARGKNKDELIQKWVVSKIGKKYVYAKPSNDSWQEVCFGKDEYTGKFNQKTNYCVDYILYLNRQEIEDENEQSELWKKIADVFRRYGINYKVSLEQLRRINAILKESENN